MSASSAAELQDADAAPLRKSKRSSNDLGHLGALGEIVTLFSPDSLPTTAEIDAKIEDLKLNGTLSAPAFEAGNSAFGRVAKLKRSATDEQLSSRVQKSRVTPPDQYDDAHHSAAAKQARDGISVSSSSSSASTMRAMFDPHSRGDLTKEFLKALKAHCARDVSDRVEALFNSLQDGKTPKIVVWHQAREILKGANEEILEQLDRVMRLTQHKPDGIEYPRSIIRQPMRVPATVETRRTPVEVERAPEPPRLDQLKLHIHSPRISVAIKDFLDVASEILRPQPQYREIMQRLAQYVIDGLSNLSEAEPLDAPSRPRYERGVKAIHAAMDFVQSFPDLHSRLRQFLAASETPERRPSVSSGPAVVGAGASTAVVPTSVPVATPAPPPTQVYAAVSAPTAVPVQYVTSPSYPYPMYEFSYMYGVGYGYPYPHYTVPTAAHEVKPPAATTYALPAGYPPYSIAVAGQPAGKPVTDPAHLPRGSTITYITAPPPPGAAYAYPPTVVSYATGVPPGYVSGAVPYSTPYVTHSYAVPAPDPLRHVVTASSVSAAAAAAAATSGNHHMLGAGTGALREPPHPSPRDTTHTIPVYHLSPPSRAVVRDDGTS